MTFIYSTQRLLAQRKEALEKGESFYTSYKPTSKLSSNTLLTQSVTSPGWESLLKNFNTFTWNNVIPPESTKTLKKPNKLPSKSVTPQEWKNLHREELQQIRNYKEQKNIILGDSQANAIPRDSIRELDGSGGFGAVLNFGIPGYTSSDISTYAKEFMEWQPNWKKTNFVVQSGINDVKGFAQENASPSEAQVRAFVKEVIDNKISTIQTIQEKAKDARIVLMPLLPVTIGTLLKDSGAVDRMNMLIKRVNEGVSQINNTNTYFVDNAYAQFLDPRTEQLNKE